MNLVSDKGSGPRHAAVSRDGAVDNLGNVEDLHHFVAVVVDDLDHDLPGC
jgi:hypothetical protein